MGSKCHGLSIFYFVNELEFGYHVTLYLKKAVSNIIIIIIIIFFLNIIIIIIVVVVVMV